MRFIVCATLWGALLGTSMFAQSSSASAISSTHSFVLSTERLDAVVQRVRALDRMTYRVGYGFSPGPFYRLVEEGVRAGRAESFKRLASDPWASVRVFALIAMAHSVDRASLVEAAAPLLADRTVVTYTNGCVIDQRATVGEIARQVLDGYF